MGILVLCLDISESMTYGEPWKINQAFTVLKKTMQSLSQDAQVGLVTFDATSEVLIEPQPVNKEAITAILGKIVPRGISCVAAGLTNAVNLIEKAGKHGVILFLTDGRANLSLNQMGGYEGSINLENELLKISREAAKKQISVHSVAVGEDAFTESLSEIAKITNGKYQVAENYLGLRTEKTQSLRAIIKYMLTVHGLPIELPAAQPTWTKESEFMHVAVVSKEFHSIYLGNRRAFLINQNNAREARIALMSIESDQLRGYRERNPMTAEKVKTGKAVLLDRSYRDYLDLGKSDFVELSIY